MKFTLPSVSGGPSMKNEKGEVIPGGGAQASMQWGDGGTDQSQDMAANFRQLIAEAGPLAALQHLLARTQLAQPATARSQFPLNQLAAGLNRQISGAIGQPRRAQAPRPVNPPSFGIAQPGLDYQGMADEAHRRKIQAEQERMGLQNMLLGNRGIEQQQALNYRREDRSQQLFNGLLSLFSRLSSGGGGL